MCWIDGWTDTAAPPERPIVIDHVALKDILGAPPFEMEVGGGRGQEALEGSLGWTDTALSAVRRAMESPLRSSMCASNIFIDGRRRQGL